MKFSTIVSMSSLFPKLTFQSTMLNFSKNRSKLELEKGRNWILILGLSSGMSNSTWRNVGQWSVKSIFITPEIKFMGKLIQMWSKFEGNDKLFGGKRVGFVMVWINILEFRRKINSADRLLFKFSRSIFRSPPRKTFWHEVTVGSEIIVYFTRYIAIINVFIGYFIETNSKYI